MDKVYRKQRRKQAQYLKQEPHSDITFQEQPSVHVFIGNGGLKNGIPRELLVHILDSLSNPSGSKYTDKSPALETVESLKQLYLPSGKDYAFATFTSAAVAATAVSFLNGVCIQEECYKNETLLSYLSPAVLNGPPVHLYLSFVDKIPSNVQPGSRKAEEDCRGMDYPPGLIFVQDFISAQEEIELTKFFKISTDFDKTLTSTPLETVTDEATMLKPIESSGKDTIETFQCFPSSQSNDLLTTSNTTPITEVKDSTVCSCYAPKAALKNRHVMHYGYEFLYGANIIDPSHPLPGGLPGVCEFLLNRIVKRGLVTEDGRPDQLTVNEYLPGAGIPSHVDTHSVFEGPILSLSLGSQVIMEFKHPDGRKIPIYLPGRSLLVMAGEARYLWSHGIPARKYDEVCSGLLGYSPPPLPNAIQKGVDRNVLYRSPRVSLTFRKTRGETSKCSCGYPLHCDTALKINI